MEGHGFSRAVSGPTGAPLRAEGRLRGTYEYTRGFNWLTITALVGLVVPSVRVLCDYSWFVGFAVSLVAYYALMKGAPR